MQNVSTLKNDKNNVIIIEDGEGVRQNDDDDNNNNEDGDDDEDNNNNSSTQRASIIINRIDPTRLKKSGLSLQYAKILQQKILEKQQKQKEQKSQQQEQDEHLQTMKKQNEQIVKPATSTAGNVVKVIIPPANVSSVDSSDKKPQLQNVSKVLSVPTITITSPPCDIETELLRENKCERLEDVKRILNRQILLRKLANNTSVSISTPLSSHIVQPKMTMSTTTTTLQLPPQTTIKSFRKNEIPSTSTKNPTKTAITNSPPIISVRKFHTIASPEVIMNVQCTQALQQSQQLQHSKLYVTTPSSTTGTIMTQSTHQAVTIAPTQPIKVQSLGTVMEILTPTQIHQHYGGIQPKIINSKAVIRPIKLPTTSTNNTQFPQLTIRPVTSLSNSIAFPMQSQQISQKPSISIITESPKTIEKKLQSKTSKTFSSTSTSKPNVIDIHGLKQLKQDSTANKPIIMKASLECKNNLLSTSEKDRSSRDSTEIDKALYTKLPASIDYNVEQKPNKLNQESDISSITSNACIQNINIDSELSYSQTTENVPIVLENKLLMPGEYIDLQGLLSKNNEPTLPNHAISGKHPILPAKSTNKKMHVIISNEKLKSAKTNMAALAKEVLQRASKSPQIVVETANKPSTMLSCTETCIKPIDSSQPAEFTTNPLPNISTKNLCNRSIKASEQCGIEISNKNNLQSIKPLESMNPEISEAALRHTSNVSLDAKETPKTALTMLPEKNVSPKEKNLHFAKVLNPLYVEATKKVVKGVTQTNDKFDIPSPGKDNFRSVKTLTIPLQTVPVEKVVENSPGAHIKSAVASSKYDNPQLVKPSEKLFTTKSGRSMDPNMTTESFQHVVKIPDTLENCPTKTVSKSCTEAIIKPTVVTLPEKELPKMKKSTKKSVEDIITKKRPTISKASMSQSQLDLTHPAIQQKVRLREKVLDFCGIKDNSNVSPEKEYPKTVEIVDDEEITEADMNAVDFVVSLLMLSSKEVPDEVNEKMKDTKIAHSYHKVLPEAKTLVEPKCPVDQGNDKTSSKKRENLEPGKEAVVNNISENVTCGNENCVLIEQDKSLLLKSCADNVAVIKDPKPDSGNAFKKHTVAQIRNLTEDCETDDCDFLKSYKETKLLDIKDSSLQRIQDQIKPNNESSNSSSNVCNITFTSKEIGLSSSENQVSTKAQGQIITDNDTLISLPKGRTSQSFDTDSGMASHVIGKSGGEECNISEMLYDEAVKDTCSSDILKQVPKKNTAIASVNVSKEIGVSSLEENAPTKIQHQTIPICTSSDISKKSDALRSKQTIAHNPDNDSIRQFENNELEGNMQGSALKQTSSQESTDTNSGVTINKMCKKETEASTKVSKSKAVALPTTSTTATSTTKTMRKRIGIRSASINLIPRKNLPLKKEKDVGDMNAVQKNKNTLNILQSSTTVTSGKSSETIVEESNSESILVSILPPKDINSIDQVNPESEKKTIKYSQPNAAIEDFDEPKLSCCAIESESNESIKNQKSFLSNLPIKSQGEIESKILNERTADKISQNIDSIMSRHILSINTEIDDEKHKENASTPQKPLKLTGQEYQSHGIKILATIPVSDNNTLYSKEQLSHAIDPQSILPEVGAIIDMKAYGLEKSNGEVIVFQNLLDRKSQQLEQSPTKSSELQSQNGNSVRASVGAEIEPGKIQKIKVNKCGDEKDSDSQSCPADICDYSDNDSRCSTIVRKRLRRKRPISDLLSTSDSEYETDKDTKRPSSQLNKCSTLGNEISSTSVSSGELFGFSEKSNIIPTTDEKRLTDEEMMSTTISTVKSTLDEISPQSTAKKSESIYTSPFVTTGSQRNIPLKKRWELSQQPPYDETDITDDTSPAGDDDTMDDEEIKNKFLEIAEVKDADIKKSQFSMLKSGSEKSTSIPFCNAQHASMSYIAEKESSKEQTTDLKMDASLIGTSGSKKLDSQGGHESEKLLKHDDSKLVVRKRGRPPKKLKTDCTLPINSSEVNSKLERTNNIGTTSTPTLTTQKKGNQKEFLSMSINNSNPRLSMGSPPQTEVKRFKNIEHNIDDSCTTIGLTSPQKKRLRLCTLTRKLSRQNSIEMEQLKTTEDKAAFAAPASIQKKRGRKSRLSTSSVDSKSDQRLSIDSSEEIFTPKKRECKSQQSVIKQEPVSPHQNKPDERKSDILNETLNASGSMVLDTAKIDTPIKKKRGRKPRSTTEVSLVKPPTKELTQTIEEHSYIESPSKERQRKKSAEVLTASDITSEEIGPEESSTPTPKRRGRKPRMVNENETQKLETLHTLEKTDDQYIDSAKVHNSGRKRKLETVDDFNPRLLLIRHRDQLNTEEILTLADSEAGNGPLQCGLCLARTTQANWYKHLGEHYGVGWVVGKEPAVETKSRSKILSRMIAYFKQKGTSLLCRLCSRSYRSPLGLLLHFESCGETIRVECPICKNQYTKLSYIVHQRTCEKARTRAENDAVDEENSLKTTEPVLTNSGRLKRMSLMKAETKLKKLTTDLSDNEAHFQPKNFIKHRTCTANNQDQKVVFYCTLCPVSDTNFETEIDGIEHVARNHKPNEKKSKDFEGDSSDYDGKSDGLIVSEESSINSEISSAESDVDNDSDTLNCKSGSSKKKSKKLTKKQPIEPKRAGNLRPVYSRRSSDVTKVVLRKWKHFIASNYTDEVLYPYATPIYGDTTQQATDLTSKIESMKFAFSSINQKPFNVLGSTPSEKVEWQNLQRFQSTDQRPSDKLIFLGGPIKTLAWVPLPESISEQYLIVSCRKDLSLFTRYKSPKKENAQLIVYKISGEKDDSNETIKRNVEIAIHYVLDIPNGPIHTIAFLPSGGYNATINRLGLLAVGTASSNIKVYALPLRPSQFNEVKINSVNEVAQIVSLDPSLELTLDASSDTKLNCHSVLENQCVHICWSEFAGHQHIFASFVNSLIAFWDIKEPANAFYNLNCQIQNGRRYFTPLNCFYFGEKVFKAFAIHYDTIGPRWLAVQGCVRKLTVYDIRNLSYPIPVKEDFLKSIPRCMDWSPIWETFVTGFCDVIPKYGSCALAVNPVGLNFSHSKMDNMVSGVSTLHYNPWQTIYGMGVDNGDIIFMNTRELNNDQQVLMRSKRNVMAISMLDIKRLDGEEVIQINSNADNIHDWQMHEKDYKDKYGLVFAHITKFTSNDRQNYLNDKRTPPAYIERYMRINIMRWNLNSLGKRYLAVGYENGFLRLTRFKRDAYFD